MYRVTVTHKSDVLFDRCRFGDWLDGAECAADTVQEVATAHGRRVVELSVTVINDSVNDATMGR